MGEKRKLFMRGNTVHEITPDEGGSDVLSILTPERFCNLVEGQGKRVARREVGTGAQEGKIVFRTTTFPISSAKILLENDAAGEHLPAIRQLANCPIMTPAGEVLTRGYHDYAGGTFINRGGVPPIIPLEVAKQALVDLLADFDFASAADCSRAIASIISPALKMGGWIDDDFPLDIAEADQSQSGKTYRQKLVCRIYGEIPSSITAQRGGVGSLDESISVALIKGRPFITLANIRGKIDSTVLEEALRGSGRVACRMMRQSAEVDSSPFLWQLSTNGAELTRDLANRSIMTRIKKRPAGYKFRTFPEGDLESHVVRNQAYFLGAVFAVLREWQRLGCPVTDESRHDFRGWCRALDGIVQHVLGMPPLLDGHREQQERTANPNLQWLREIILATNSEDFDRKLNTGEFLRIAEDAGIDFPGNPHSKDEPVVRTGRILARLFREAEGETITVDGFIFQRGEAPDYSPNAGGSVRKFYIITKS